MSDNNSTQRLVNLLGFDPARRPSATQELLKEVLGDLNKERSEKAKELVKAQLAEAVQLREQMHRLESEFNKNRAKFDKQLGKILNSLESALRGQPVAEETEQAPEGEQKQE